MTCVFSIFLFSAQWNNNRCSFLILSEITCKWMWLQSVCQERHTCISCNIQPSQSTLMLWGYLIWIFRRSVKQSSCSLCYTVFTETSLTDRRPLQLVHLFKEAITDSKLGIAVSAGDSWRLCSSSGGFVREEACCRGNTIQLSDEPSSRVPVAAALQEERGNNLRLASCHGSLRWAMTTLLYLKKQFSFEIWKRPVCHLVEWEE